MEMRGGKRFRTKEERREIVEETLKAGASVSRVARAHDVNTNQVFQWRRQYHAGLLEEGKTKSTALVPVQITKALLRARTVKARPRQIGAIDIDLGHARVRIEGPADPDCIRAALEGLTR